MTSGRTETSHTLLTAGQIAWGRYASAVHRRLGPLERDLAYRLARLAEQRIWAAEGAPAANLKDPV